MDGRLNRFGNRMIFGWSQSKRVCQETIYRYIYSKEGMSQDFVVVPAHRNRKNRTPAAVLEKRPRNPSSMRDVSNPIQARKLMFPTVAKILGIGRRFNAV